jgi:hypothetical protein
MKELMTMKKLILSKPFLAGTLAVLCVGILAAFLLWSRDGKTEFIPDAPVPAAPIDRWTESPAAGEASEPDAESRPTDNRAAIPAAEYPMAAEEYPLVVEQNNDVVVLDFTDPTPSREAPPAAPGTNPDDAPPATPPPAFAEPPQSSPAPSPPCPEA